MRILITVLLKKGFSKQNYIYRTKEHHNVKNNLNETYQPVIQYGIFQESERSV